MTNPILSNLEYIKIRNDLLIANEGFSTTIYFDTNGIPTVGTGVALLGSNGSINTANMQVIADVLGVNSVSYGKIQDFTQKVSTAIIGTPSIQFPPKGISFDKNWFMASERGQAIKAAFGGVGVHYVDGSSFVLDKGAISLEKPQAQAINDRAANDRENGLDNLIATNGGDKNTLSIAERAVLFEAYYQSPGSTRLKNAIVNFFTNGHDDQKLLDDLKSSQYPQRVRNDGLLLFGNNPGFTVTNTTPTNPSTFDLSADPSGLNPTTTNSLGSSSHGWGLAAGGAGYAAVVSSTYVNNDGFVIVTHFEYLKRLLWLIIFSFISLNAFGENKNINDYIKIVSSEINIVWSENSCEKEFLFDMNTSHKIINKCKIEVTEAEGMSTYLMDINGDILYAPYFIPVKQLIYENGYGLILYSDNDAVSIFLTVNNKGSFEEKYIVDGDIVENSSKSGLAYPGLLVWLSYNMLPNDCVTDFSRLLNKKSNYFNSLYLRVPTQIKIIDLKFGDIGVEKNIILSKIIDETLAKLYPRLESEENTISKDDYKQRIFVFLAANASDNHMLKVLVNRYKNYIGKDIIDIYNSTKSCL